jgi:hypothetical protein
MDDEEEYLAAFSRRKNESAGESAYRKYGEVTGRKNFQGDPMPAWEDLPVKIREAWFNAAVEAWKNIQEANTEVRYLT